MEENNIHKKRAEPIRHARRIDSIRLDENDSTYWTKEGYLVDHPVLTSVGIFQYVNPDGSTRRELRLPEYIFDEESLKTYRGKPIIITHNAGRISKNNVGNEQIERSSVPDIRTETMSVQKLSSTIRIRWNPVDYGNYPLATAWT